MSIKRISRRRVAAPIMEYVEEAPLNDTRAGGSVETKINPPVQTSAGGDIPSRVDTRVETKDGPGGDIQSRAGTNIETRTNTEVETRHSTTEGSKTEPSGGKDAPTVSKWSV